MNTFYEVQPIQKPICRKVEVPGSKSITNRALLLAAMSQGKSVLTNVLFSDDSRGLMECLQTLGYDMTVSETEKTVALLGGSPCKKARINVRSAGTAARFITAMLAAYEGEYTIESSDQMKSRPMKPLMDVLHELGCDIAYKEKEGFLPFTLRGGNLSGGKIVLDSEISSQFLSALLMTGCLHRRNLSIQPKGRENARPYVDITVRMMEQFGVRVRLTEERDYVVPAGQAYSAQEYPIEPDVSNACYFYAAAALTGGSVLVKGVYRSSMQGDIQFLDILKKMGCTCHETPEGICLEGPVNGIYEGIAIDMNSCSDQTMTLAALAPFAASPTTIRNVGHIKYQESNRILAIVTELSKMGIRCEETADGILIYPGTPKASAVETYEDHRMAMAFSLIGLRTAGIRIMNPSCTAKTFENYFDVFGSLAE